MRRCAASHCSSDTMRRCGAATVHPLGSAALLHLSVCPRSSRLRGLFHMMVAAIERPEQHRAGRRRRPAVGTSLLRARASDALGVERASRCAWSPCPFAAQLEDPPHDGRLGLVDAPLDVAVHPQVVVAEHAAAGDVARPAPCGPSPRASTCRSAGGTRRSSRARTMPVMLAAKFPYSNARAVLVEPDRHAGLRDALQFAEGLVAVAPAEPRGVPHDQHLERRAAARRSRRAAAGG